MVTQDDAPGPTNESGASLAAGESASGAAGDRTTGTVSGPPSAPGRPVVVRRPERAVRRDTAGDDSFVRSARRWLTAYPVRWRSVRGDEVIGVLRDLAGPDARRLSLREGLGLLRAGWTTRWRTRPPFVERWRYRWSQTRPIDRRYREWARDDIAGRFYETRQWLWRMFPLVGSQVWLAWNRRDRDLLVMWAFLMAAAVALDVLRLGGARDRAVRQHLVPAAWESPTPGGLVRVWRLRPRVDARSGADLTAALLGLGALVWWPATLVVGARLCAGACVETTTMAGRSWTWVVAALLATGVALVGIGAAALARWRLRRFLPMRPGQPGRELVTLRRGHYGAWGLVVFGVAVQAWFEATGRLTAFFTPIGALVCLVLLPGARVIRRAARRGPDDLAYVDLVRITATGGVPLVDAVQPWAARAATPPVLEGGQPRPTTS